jgi:D-sedoheptulose 7-phosphate isomerase
MTEFDSIDHYLSSLEDVIHQISRQEVLAVTCVLFDAWRRGARIFIMGNGGSAATASHMANDLNKGVSVPGRPRVKAIALTDNVPLMTAWGNDTAYEDIFVEQMLNFLESGDVIIGISTSGNSPNVLRALRVAQQHGAITVGFTGRDGGQLRQLVDYCVFIPSDHIGQQEDGHMILDHVISLTLRQLVEAETVQATNGVEDRIHD